MQTYRVTTEETQDGWSVYAAGFDAAAEYVRETLAETPTAVSIDTNPATFVRSETWDRQMAITDNVDWLASRAQEMSRRHRERMEAGAWSSHDPAHEQKLIAANDHLEDALDALKWGLDLDLRGPE